MKARNCVFVTLKASIRKAGTSTAWPGVSLSQLNGTSPGHAPQTGRPCGDLDHVRRGGLRQFGLQDAGQGRLAVGRELLHEVHEGLVVHGLVLEQDMEHVAVLQGAGQVLHGGGPGQQVVQSFLDLPGIGLHLCPGWPGLAFRRALHGGRVDAPGE